MIPERHRRLIFQVLTSISIHCAMHSPYRQRPRWARPNAKINPTAIHSRPVLPGPREERERETIIMLITANVRIIIIVIKLPAN